MKNTYYITCFLLLSSILVCNSQTTSPYQTDFWKDGAWVVTGVGLNVYGLSLITNKDDITLEELNNLSKDDVNGIDRWIAGNYSEQANMMSDIPFYASFTTPFLLLLDKDIRKNAGQLSVMLVETMSTTGALFTLSAGLINRSRPLVYATDAPLKDRLSKDSQRSFFSGHTAASAAATFFAAQVYSDFFPDSKAKPYIWAGAATIPAVVGYLRIKSGDHFLTDVALGYVIGAATGIFIPRLHKRKKDNLKISPGIGFNQQTIHISYRF